MAYRRKRSFADTDGGLWERYAVDSTLSFDSCAVLTMPAIPQIVIAERMPALLTARSARHWLEGSPFDLKSFTAPLTDFAFQCQSIFKR